MRNLLFIFSLISLLSCTKNTNIAQNPKQIEVDSRASKIQLIHASPGTAGIKLWQNNATELLVGRYYKSFTQYFPIQAGNTQFNLKRSSTNMLLNSFPAVIKEGSLYSLFVCDSPARLTPVLIHDNPLPTKSDQAQIRFVNILSSGESLDCVIKQTTFFKGIDYKNASEYMYTSPGLLTASVKLSDSGKTLLSDILFSLDAGKNYTIFVNGFSYLTGASGADALIMTNL
jgi:hypothetical protein